MSDNFLHFVCVIRIVRYIFGSDIQSILQNNQIVGTQAVVCFQDRQRNAGQLLSATASGTEIIEYNSFFRIHCSRKAPGIFSSLQYVPRYISYSTFYLGNLHSRTVAGENVFCILTSIDLHGQFYGIRRKEIERRYIACIQTRSIIFTTFQTDRCSLTRDKIMIGYILHGTMKGYGIGYSMALPPAESVFYSGTESSNTGSYRHVSYTSSSKLLLEQST